MLTLRNDWHRLTGGGVALYLLKQVPVRVLRTEVARQLIHASLEIQAAAYLKRTGRIAKLTTLSRGFRWRLGRLVYAFFPSVDDAVLAVCASLAIRKELTVIVQSKRAALLKYALKRTLDGRAPVVFSVGDFISWRSLWASADLKTRHDQILLAILERYNSLVSRGRHGRTIMVCAVTRRDVSVGVRPIRQLSLQPVAIEAAVEVTKPSEPSMERGDLRPREWAGRNEQ